MDLYGEGNKMENDKNKLGNNDKKKLELKEKIRNAREACKFTKECSNNECTSKKQKLAEDLEDELELMS